MATSTISSDVRITGNLTAASISSTAASITGAMCSPNMELGRTKLAQDTNQPFHIPLTDFRVHDALQTNLPGTAATDDLAIDSGTFGTEGAHLTAGDLKAAGATTRYARCTVQLPAEYDDAETVSIRIAAKVGTTVSDTTCTVDVEAYEIASDLTVGSDLCTTAAQSCNSLTSADLDFTITPSGLVSGDRLDLRIAVICNDAATGTVVEPQISAVTLLCDIKG